VIAERNVSKGLRRTLLTQARRLALLAEERLGEINEDMPVEQEGEETGEHVAQQTANSLYDVSGAIFGLAH
jgi:hypothetical protein